MRLHDDPIVPRINYAELMSIAVEQVECPHTALIIYLELHIAPQAIDRLKARVRELTRRTGGQSLSQVTKEPSCYLIGWRGYFGFCETPSVLYALDQWIRRRLRAIAWKQWKRGRTRFVRLRRRGVGRELAAKTAGSPHGPWRLSNSPALNIALSNAFFASLDLATLAPKRVA